MQSEPNSDSPATQQNSDIPKRRVFSIVWIPVGVALALIISYAIFFGAYKSAPAGDPSSWGEFGDFLGGLLNPVVGIVTIILLVRTLGAQKESIDMQRVELALQRSELESQRKETARSADALTEQHKAIAKQSFEQAFFAWLQSYRQLLVGLELRGLTSQRVLIDLIQPILAHQHEHGSVTRSVNGRPASYAGATALYQSGESEILAHRFLSALESYERIYNVLHTNLGPLLRTLFRMLEWVDNSSLSNADKWHYAAIVRSQLSWPEMMILAYNGCTKKGANFVPLMERYALLDNLDECTDELIAAMRGPFISRPPKGFPYSAKTFNSSRAKWELDFIELKDI